MTVFDRIMTIWNVLGPEEIKNLEVVRGNHICFEHQGRAWECSSELHCSIVDGAVRSFNAEAHALTDLLETYWNKYRG